MFPAAKSLHNQLIKVFDDEWKGGCWEQIGEPATDELVILLSRAQKALISHQLRDWPYVSLREFPPVIV